MYIVCYYNIILRMTFLVPTLLCYIILYVTSLPQSYTSPTLRKKCEKNLYFFPTFSPNEYFFTTSAKCSPMLRKNTNFRKIQIFPRHFVTILGSVAFCLVILHLQIEHYKLGYIENFPGI